MIKEMIQNNIDRALNDKLNLKVEIDTYYCCSPREDSNVTEIYAQNDRYDFNEFDGAVYDRNITAQDMHETLMNTYSDILLIKALFMYQHSNSEVKLYTDEYNPDGNYCFYRGFLGFIYIRAKNLYEITNMDKLADLERYIKIEIDTYNQYLDGEIYRWVITNDHNEVVESLTGFYREKDARDDGESSLAYFQEKYTEEMNKVKNNILKGTK